MRRTALVLLLSLLALGPSTVVAGQAGVEAPVVVGPGRRGGGGGGGGVIFGPGREMAARGRSIPIGTGVITGHVTEARTGLPVPYARVALNGAADAVGPQRANVPPGVTPGRPLSRVAMTDDDGKFVFDAVPEGEFALMVTRGGFLGMAYGAKKPDRPGTPIRVTGNQRVDVGIGMMRGGAIAGTIAGPNGEPLTQAQVRAVRVTMNSGVRRLQQTGNAMTDDRGAYRMYNLAPGEYLIGATPSAQDVVAADRVQAETASFTEALDRARRGTGPLPPAIQVTVPVTASTTQPPAYAATYYPGTPAVSNAVTMTIAPDSERLGVDFSAAFVRASHVVGTVTGMPAAGTRVTLDVGAMRTWATTVQIVAYPEDSSSDGGLSFGSSSGPTGEFTLYNLTPGRYTVLAQTRTTVVQTQPAAPGTTLPPPTSVPDDPALWGRATVDVDGRSTPEITIALQPARTISGRVEYDMSAAGAARPQVSVFATRAPDAPPVGGGPTPQGRVEPDGRFTITNVVPGRYVLGASVFVKSAIVNGQDSLDVPFDVQGDNDIANVVVTVTDRLSELSGTLAWSSGASASDYTVVIVPADRRYWTPSARRIQSARPSSVGRYVFRGLPEGNYLLAAVTDLEPGSQYDPAFLKVLAGAAVPVTIADGGRHVQDIRVGK